MASLDDVISQMVGPGLPALPPGGVVCDGKEHRYGKDKKAWYKLNEVIGLDGKTRVFGVFGYWRGTENGAVGVSLDADEVSKEAIAAAREKQAEAARIEEEKRVEAAHRAANRARSQWDAAGANGLIASPYLARKKITSERVRIASDGTLLVPMKKYSQADGMRLVGLQKIAADGSKRFNEGLDKVGAFCMLGAVGQDTPLIMVGEGYATVRSARMAVHEECPGAVAFDAGNILPVVQGLRRDFPAAHLLLLADDDWQLEQRLAERLQKEFLIAESVPVDGVEHVRTAEKGPPVRITASWREDGCAVRYIEVDIRVDRQMRNIKFENAGISKCMAAARAVGNASVVWPRFADRGENKWSDFNDLHVEQSLDAVREQLDAAIEAALSAVPVVPAVSPAPSLPDALPVEANPDSPAPSVSVDPISPAPIETAAASNVVGIVSLAWALAHCALVQGSTDVWDSLNKLRIKQAAFVLMMGKEGAKAWQTHAERRSISPRNLPRTVKGVAAAAANGGAGGDDIVMMLDRYTLLYGTKTVFDAEKKTILGYDAMALARGGDLAQRWISHPLHMEKDLDKLVFDPTQRVDLNTHINLFEGFPLKPKRDDAKAELVLELLWSLCSAEKNAEDLYKWVLCWLAYPLQHPGAKMQTALLFFGEKQGTGKSLFFEGIVKPIYGAHGATGGQHQLESQYTMWRSQKLFVLFEEILSRQDKYSYFGLIKHMITGRDSSISQKFKDDRTEANHLNCVMLSNEFQAVPLEPDDRRFVVADVRTLLDPDLLARIKAALDDGLSAAFYAFLLAYPLGDFDAYTWPLMTPSKQRVIDFGRPDWESFYLTWSADGLTAPFCSCLSEDLYIVYSRYCSRYGYRSMSLTKFSELIAQRVPKDRQWVAIGAARKKLLTVFHVPSDDGEPLSKQCERFRDLADIKAAS